MMRILESYKTSKEGNDCLIKRYVMLIMIDNDYYQTIYSERTVGGWISDEHLRQSVIMNFPDLDSATEHYRKLKKSM